jgi:signal transduction histidine kinase
MSMVSSLHRGDMDSAYGVTPHAPRLLILDEAAPDGFSSSSWGIKSALESRGYDVVVLGSWGEAVERLQRGRPDLLLVAAASDGRLAGADVHAVARELGIPVLGLVDSGNEQGPGIAFSDDADDWFVRNGSSEELAARVGRLVRRRLAPARAPVASPAGPIDVRFSSLVVHDLRSPLNVIGLSLRMIEQVLPMDDPDVAEDMRFIDENFRQLERMLSEIGDYARLFEPGLRLTPSPFDPRRLVGELLENRELQGGGPRGPVLLSVETSAPTEVTLDQQRARMAIEYVLANATAAAGEDPIRLTLGAGSLPQRWLIEVAVDRPPPSSVHPMELDPRSFERLCGTGAERRGIDLAIAARVSELFGGTGRLEVVDAHGTTVILDWPTEIALGPGHP